ncbi:hypothetical protein [Streptomyces sp. SM12]|uniref:hypothetical protein n=1 Tax=Streptomyces sp. SM12 TaxID=1071602 RepID=UPI000CD59098|nr:hypothetical protein [Streptomyces sp. SM12]
MKRHVLVPVVAVATAGLLLTGCSNGDAEPDDDIAGVDTSEPADTDEDEPAEDEEPGEDEPDDGIDRPEIEVADDVENVFEESVTDNADESAALADQERYISAVDEAVNTGDLDRPGLRFYASGDGLASAVDYVTSMHDGNLTFAGTTRYYQRSITLREDGVATTSYCVDFSGSYLVNTETGEREPDDDVPFFYTSRLERNGDGVWVTTGYDVNSGDVPCE